VTLLFPDCVIFGGHGVGYILAKLLRVQGLYSLQELDGLAEVLVVDGHGDVDGVVVAPAFEASGEVGLGVGGGLESAALGA
jgi:hypothetical protein